MIVEGAFYLRSAKSECFPFWLTEPSLPPFALIYSQELLYLDFTIIISL